MHPIIDGLTSLLGDKGVLSGVDAEPYAVDVTGKSASCLAVVRPASTDEVAQIVRLCSHHDVAIVPQGGNRLDSHFKCTTCFVYLLNEGFCGRCVPETFSGR